MQIIPTQANNAYIFPAVGHAALITQCTTITDEVFLEAASALAQMATPEQLQQNRLFPPLSDIRNTSEILIAHLAEFMVQKGLGQVPAGLRGGLDKQGWLRIVRERMFYPTRKSQSSSDVDEEQQMQDVEPYTQQQALVHSKM